MAYPHAGAFGSDNFLAPGNAGPLPVGTPITVYQPGTTTLAGLFSNRDRTGAMPNPAQLGALGNLRFYAEPGDYDVLVNGATLRVTALPDPADTVGDDVDLETQVDVRDYGPTVGTGGDDTAAIDAAFAASQLSAAPFTGSRPLVFPAGTYNYNGTGLNPSGTANITIRGDGRGRTHIVLGASSYLVKATGVLNRVDMHDFSLTGGLGMLRQTYTGANVVFHLSVHDIDHRFFTESFIQSECVDQANWKIERCMVWATAGSDTIGIALSGLTDMGLIRDVEFLYCRVALKVRRGGNNLHIQSCSHIKGAPGADPRVDIWLVSDTTSYVNSGTGCSITDWRFGNENLTATDYRILFADELAGPSNGARFPNLAADSTGYVSSVRVSGGSWTSNGVSARALIYSTTRRVAGCMVGWIPTASLVVGTNIIDFRTPSVIPDYQASTNLFGPFTSTDGNINLLNLGLSNAKGVGALVDPLGLIADPSTYSESPGDPADFDDLMNVTTDNFTMLSGDSKVAATDAKGGTDAATFTLAAGSYCYGSLQPMTPGVPAWVEFDVMGGTLTGLRVAVSDGGSPYHWARMVPVVSGQWKTCGPFQFTPRSAGTSPLVQLKSQSASSGTVIVGRVRVYHGSRPMAVWP